MKFYGPSNKNETKKSDVLSTAGMIIGFFT